MVVAVGLFGARAECRGASFLSLAVPSLNGILSSPSIVPGTLLATVL